MYIKHSAKGREWSEHKYIRKENGRYIYKEGQQSKPIQYGEELNDLTPEQAIKYSKLTRTLVNLGMEYIHQHYFSYKNKHISFNKIINLNGIKNNGKRIIDKYKNIKIVKK